MAEILDHLREAFQSNSKVSESSRLAWWAQLPVLAIDEFDRVRDTGYGQERRFVLMDRRYEGALRQENVTIMASNSDPSTCRITCTTASAMAASGWCRCPGRA